MSVIGSIGAPTPSSALSLSLTDRISRLRQMTWDKTHEQALVYASVTGCGADTLTGHARDFAALLEASAPLIQPEELIVGCCLATPVDRSSLNLGFYDSHYPPGHGTILRLGPAGMRDMARARAQAEPDPDKREFLRAVEIAYDAACRYVERYGRCADEMAAAEQDPRRKGELERIAAVCHQLAVAPPSSFHAALQLLQFTRVFWGSGSIGRFDQWMLPFYRSDIQRGALTRESALELLECLFIKLNHFAGPNKMSPRTFVSNDSLRNITLAGQTPDGRDACNELTYLCLEASAALMLPEPKLNVRFFLGSPSELLSACCRLLAAGANVLAIYNDELVLSALARLGVPPEDARNYCNDGCSELIIGGMSTIHFRVYDALAALRETVMHAGDHLYPTFADVLDDFKSRLVPFMPTGPAPDQAITHPYFAASIGDCLDLASPTGARYSMWGTILAEVGNAADGLAAVKKLIYEDQSLTWAELIAALDADYRGYEPLRQMLLNRVPKYGNDDDRADILVKEIAEYFCDGVHARAGNTSGRGGKWAPGFMSFGIHQKSDLPATPDGRRQGDPTANSFSPAVGMDRSGPTAVLKSVSRVDLSKASHGSVLDIALHSSVFRGDEGSQKIAALVDTFLTMPCTATLQLNVIDRDTLLRARANPHAPEFRTLIVRVWGFSAVFVELPPALQDHVLARTEHQ